MATTQDAPARLTAEQAQRVAENFILDQIGDQVMAGEPWLVSSALSSAWVTPLILTSSAYGAIGAIGVLVIDNVTGQVIASTPPEVLQEKAERLYKGKGSAIEKAFHDLVTMGIKD